MKRTTYTIQVRSDPATQDRILYIKAVLGHILPDVRVSQSTIVRRAINLYLNHLENILSENQSNHQNSRHEGYHIHHHSQDHRFPWPDDVFPVHELETEGEKFPRLTHLEKKYREKKPKLNERLKLDLKRWDRNE